MTKASAFGSRSTADQVLAGIDLSGKHILVTGCGSGLGRETMQALAANGAHVIGLSRTFESAARSCQEVAYNTEPVGCDLGDLDSVGDVVQQIRSRGTQLDAIVANAAVAFLPTLNTRYGVEMQFLVNHIGHFALVTQLQDLLRSGSGRVVVVTDRAAQASLPRGGVMFDNLAGQRFYGPEAFYGQSKLANLLFAKELSRRLRNRGVAVNAVDPGSARGTRLHRYRARARRAWHALTAPFIKSQSQASSTAALLAGSPSVTGLSGELWRDCRTTDGGSHFVDTKMAAELWRISEEIVTSRQAPRVSRAEPSGALAAA